MILVYGFLNRYTYKLFYASTLDVLFSSNHEIHKSSHGLYFWASDPLSDRFYKNI